MGGIETVLFDEVEAAENVNTPCVAKGLYHIHVCLSCPLVGARVDSASGCGAGRPPAKPVSSEKFGELVLKLELVLVL